MARCKQIVESISEALNQSAHYSEAAGFMIAPLSQRGGARSWHVVDWEKDVWVRDDEDEAELVGLDVDPSTLPPLPPSRIGLWAFSFVNSRNEHLKPQIQIKQCDADEEKAEPLARPSAIHPRNEAIVVLTETLRQSNEETRATLRAVHQDARMALDQTMKVLALTRSEMEQVYAGRRADMETLARVKQEEIESLREQIKQVKGDLDEILKANRDLSEANLQLRYHSQFYETVQTLFAGKPEKLIEGIQSLLSGIAKAAQQLKE